MSSADADRPTVVGTAVEVRAAARTSVREVVAAGGVYGRSGHRWVVPVVAAAAVAAAACAPVAWPLLVGGTAVASSALQAAFGQVGAVGGGVLTEVVMRTWDRLRAHEGPHIGQSELQEALTGELKEALVSSSVAAAGLRTEVAGVLRGVDAVKIALTTTIETTARESADQVRAVLITGLRDLGTQFTEFGWLLEEVNDQITRIAEKQAEIAASSRAMLEAQQRTLMQLMILLQQTRPVYVNGGGPGGHPEVSDTPRDETRGPVDHECPYPGLTAFKPQDVNRFFGRKELTAVVVTRLVEQLTQPGLLMVLGPSGSGKSSLLRAGLLPAIAAGELPVRGSLAWPQDLMTPGPRPLLELATRIAALAGISAGAVEADLRTDPARTTAAIRQALLAHAGRHAQFSGLGPGPAAAITDMEATGDPVPGATAARHQIAEASPGQVASSPRLVLIVDQFEELFTQCTDERERRAFIHALCAAAGTTAAAPLPGGSSMSGVLLTSRVAPALVVIGMRADFYTRSAAYPELVPYLQDHQVLVGPLDQDGLRAAIERPAASAGLVVDAGLVEVLLADLGLHRRPSSPLASAEAPGMEAGSGHVQPAGDSYEAGRLPLLAYALQQTGCSGRADG
jgi:conflict system STAND superfamily ATPase